MSDGPELVLVRYGELALKGGNRGEFEKRLVGNMRRALAGITPATLTRERGRVVVRPERRVEAAARRLQDVFGISSISPARGVATEREAILACARVTLAEAVAELPQDRATTFRVSVRRADKTFPMGSSDFERVVADHVLVDHPALVVRLADPELTLEVDLRPERSYVFARRLPGPGGLPVGTQGRVLCLVSGGFDSPVAAWMSMKRGAEVVFTTFHSPPFIGDAARKKVVDLVRVLTRYQASCVLHVVPFAEAQTAIRDAGHEAYRTVLYRRMMQRIATRLARAERAQALVTGECLGQVASQTLENLACIGAAAGLPVLRPLIGFDKQETIALARRIGTHDLSERQEPDCCTLFMPERPVIRGRLEECEAIESVLDLEALAHDALERSERLVIEGRD
ncbi:MAG TPA: tRNA uracil 4-sulfurtransferase ThiI [Planctomycetota bacterium]|nr:tRNA uracil 4-sulfurtransferase ThiI [Planctomycetota bacterium]